jgi:hypothetical protein
LVRGTSSEVAMASASLGLELPATSFIRGPQASRVTGF